MLIDNASQKTERVYRYASWKPKCLNWVARAMLYAIYSRGERPHMILGCSALFPTPSSNASGSAVHEDIDSLPWRKNMESILHVEKHQAEVFVRIYHRFIYSAFPVFDTTNVSMYLDKLSKSDHYHNSPYLGIIFQIFGLASMFAERAYGWDRNSKELLSMAKNYGILKDVDSRTGDTMLFQTRTLVMLEYILNSDYARAMRLISTATAHLQRLSPTLSAETSYVFFRSMVNFHYVMAAGPDDWVIASTATPAPVPQVTPSIFGFKSTKYFNAEDAEFAAYIRRMIHENAESLEPCLQICKSPKRPQPDFPPSQELRHIRSSRRNRGRAMSLASKVTSLFSSGTSTSAATQLQRGEQADFSIVDDGLSDAAEGSGNTRNFRMEPRAATLESYNMAQEMAEEEERPPYLHSMIAGGIGGTTGDLLMHSLDTVKTRQQGDPHIPPKYSSMSASYSMILRQEGIRRGLYGGWVPAMLGSFPGTIIFFGTYEYTKRHLIDSGVTPQLAYLSSGFFADFAASFIYVPSEVLKTRLQLQGRYNNPYFNSGYNYKSTLHAARTIVRQEGVSALFHGYKATIFRDLPFSALQFTFYEQAQSWSRRWKKSRDIGLSLELLTGAAAGGLAGVITCPLDVVKTRIQTQVNHSVHPILKSTPAGKPIPVIPRNVSSVPSHSSSSKNQQTRSISTSSPSTHTPRPGAANIDTSSVLTGLKIIYKTEGLMGWFRGVGPRFVWTSVQSGCMLLLYQSILRRLEIWDAGRTSSSEEEFAG
ncbi:hypothetical protein B7463_g1894, partial [Scytalidium lignicola]